MMSEYDQYKKDFNAKVEDGKWLYLYDEDGSFDLREREVLFTEYIACRKDGNDADYMRDYRGVESFAKGKQEIVGFLVGWKNELAYAVSRARGLRKYPRIPK